LPRGQSEAARALGMSYMQTIVNIILPQALYNMLPAMVSQFVSTIKETSLGYVISVNELTFAANQVNSTLLTKPFPVFMLLALIYFLLCFSLSQFAHFLERRISKKRAGVGAGNKKPAEPDVNLVIAQAVE
ncbi:amino acid ABC transporter permease, partial [Undibacterium sp.]